MGNRSLNSYSVEQEDGFGVSKRERGYTSKERKQYCRLSTRQSALTDGCGYLISRQGNLAGASLNAGRNAPAR